MEYGSAGCVDEDIVYPLWAQAVHFCHVFLSEQQMLCSSLIQIQSDLLVLTINNEAERTIVRTQWRSKSMNENN